MRASDLIKKIEALILIELKKLDSLTQKNYLSMREAITKQVRELWDVASVTPVKDAEVGNIRHVSKAEAYKYNRMIKLTDNVKGIIKDGANVDIRNIEVAGIKIYETGYNGYAWVYNQGYNLPITGGVPIKLLAQSLYSDFYGLPFFETVKKNLGAFADNILATVSRGLTQGLSYTKIAKEIVKATDRAFNRAILTARTEGGRIQMDAYLDGLRLLDEQKIPYQKMWNASIDNRTRERHITMDGQYADKDGVFHLPGGITGAAPHKTGNAADDCNCRCTAVTVIDGVKPTERAIRNISWVGGKRHISQEIIPYETFRERLERGGTIPVHELKKALAK